MLMGWIGGQQACAVNNGQNLHTIRAHSIDDSVRTFNQLTNRNETVFGNYFTRLRSVAKLPCTDGYPVDHSNSISLRVARDALVDVNKVGDGSFCPDYVHGVSPNLRRTSETSTTRPASASAIPESTHFRT